MAATKFILGIIATIFSFLNNDKIARYNADVPLLHTTANLLFVTWQIFSTVYNNHH